MRGWTKILIVNLLIFFIGILLVELIFGNWFSPNYLNRLYLIRDRNFNFDVSHLYDTNNIVRYSRDVYGFRGIYTNVNDIDIVTIGGSTTDQRYITEGETWQDVIKEAFLKKGKKLNIVNAGVNGQTTYGHIKNFDWWFPNIPDLKSKYFMFYIGINDLFRGRDNEYDKLVGNEKSVIQSIKERSALYFLYRSIQGNWVAHITFGVAHTKVDFGKVPWTDKPEIENHYDLIRDRLLEYEKRLYKLVEKVRSFNAVPIFVTQQLRYYKKSNEKIQGIAKDYNYYGQKINGVDIYWIMKLINERTMAVCHQQNGLCIDLAEELEFQNSDFYDFSHSTPSGSRKIGKFLYNKLENILD